MKKIILLISYVLCSSQSIVAQNSSYKGIGVAYLKKSLTEEPSLSDTMIIYSSKSFSNVTARFVFDSSNRFDSKVLSESIEGQVFFEFDYESFGLPVSKVGADFIEVIYGIDSNAKRLKGFIHRGSDSYGYREWDSFFLGYPIFFNQELSLRFFDDYCGKEKYIPVNKLDSGQEDYIMYPLEIKKGWMKVRLVTPSDYCDTPEAPSTQEVWIKYMDGNGNLMIWYSVRGC
jgi:hypothetical protein